MPLERAAKRKIHTPFSTVSPHSDHLEQGKQRPLLVWDRRFRSRL